MPQTKLDRIALYEVMPFREVLKEMVHQGASGAEIKTAMIREGVKTLRIHLSGRGMSARVRLQHPRLLPNAGAHPRSSWQDGRPPR